MPEDATRELLSRIRGGDREALDVLCGRYLPRLRRWAHGRLPPWARGRLDTDDLVQETVVRSLEQMDAFEPRWDGALQAYFRHALVNRIRDEIRWTARRPAAAELRTDQPARSPSPLDAAVDSETRERYEAALLQLEPVEQELIVARLELGYSYQEMADGLGGSSPDAVRMAVARSLVRLAKRMAADRVR
jgi:RNA polymerase sigma-70 factor, ECF subfamily